MSLEAVTPADLAALLDGGAPGEATEAFLGLLGDEWAEVYPPAAQVDLRSRLDAAGWPEPFAACPACQTVFLRRFYPESGRCRECAAALETHLRWQPQVVEPSLDQTRIWGQPADEALAWALEGDRAARDLGDLEEGRDWLAQRALELSELAARAEAANWLGGGGPDPSDEVRALPATAAAARGESRSSDSEVEAALGAGRSAEREGGTGAEAAEAATSEAEVAGRASEAAEAATSAEVAGRASEAAVVATSAEVAGRASEAELAGRESEAEVAATSEAAEAGKSEAEVAGRASEAELAGRASEAEVAATSEAAEAATSEAEVAGRASEAEVAATSEAEVVATSEAEVAGRASGAGIVASAASASALDAAEEALPSEDASAEDVEVSEVGAITEAGGFEELDLEGEASERAPSTVEALGSEEGDEASLRARGAGAAELREETGRRAGRVHTLALGSSFSIGTARRGEVVLRQRGVAFKHAEIAILPNGAASLTDLGTGQTWLGETLLVPNEAKHLASGDLVRCGEARLSVTLRVAEALPPAPVAVTSSARGAASAPWVPPSAAEVAAARHTPPSEILAALPASQLDLVARAARAVPLARWRATQPRSERAFVDHDAEAFTQLSRGVLDGRFLPADATGWLRWEEGEGSFLCRSALKDGTTVILAPWDLLARLPEPLPGSGPARVGRFLELLLPRGTGRLIAEEEGELAGGFWRCRYASRAGLCGGRFSSIEARSNGHVLTATLTPRFPIQGRARGFAEDPLDQAMGDLRARPAWRPPPRGQGAPAPRVPSGGRQRERHLPRRSRARDPRL